VEWAARLFPASPFLNATSLLSGSTTQTWTDFGDTNRPPPSSVTQRFYRINAAP